MGTVTIETVSETVVSSSNGSPRNSELTDKHKRRLDRKKKKLEKQGNALKNNDYHLTNQKDIIHHTVSREERKTEEAEITTKEDQVYPIETIVSNSTLPAESCQQTRVCSHEGPGAAQNINPILSTGDTSQPDANMTCSRSKSLRRSRKKKEKNNALRDYGVDFHTTNAGVAAKCDAMDVSEAQGSELMNIAERFAVSVADGGMVQRVETDVKADATVSEPQNPKSTKKKRKRNKEKAICDPSGNKLVATKDIGSVQSLLECSNGEDMGNNDRNADQEFACKELTSEMENSAASVKSGVRNLGRINLENEKDENTEVNQVDVGAESVGTLGGKKGKKEKGNALRGNATGFHTTNAGVAAICDAMDVSEAQGSELMDMAEKSAVSVGDDAMVQRVETDVKADATVSKPKNPKSKKRKRKRTKTMEVCDPSGNTLVATKNSRSAQSLLECSNGEDMGNNDRNADQEFACKELTSKMEKFAASVKSEVQNLGRTNLENKKDENTEANQDVVGAEAVSTLGGKKRKKRKGKKKKSCPDHETANMESKEEMEVKAIGESISGNRSVKDEEREVDSSLSSYVVGQDNVAQGVASGEIGENLPRCTCLGHCSRKLLVLDLNGILADVVQGYYGKITPDGKVSGRSVFRRPFLASFLEFCFERFDVGIWSSRRIGLSTMINIVMRTFANRLLFRMDSKICTQTKFKTLENGEKPLVLKDLRRVWDRFGTCHSCGKRKYDETNTLLVDDSPYKALCNPPHTGIFPPTYQHTDREDSALGPNGDLRLYLERLANAENVQKFVKENPFGEPAISESHASWGFYSKVIQRHIRIKSKEETIHKRE